MNPQPGALQRRIAEMAALPKRDVRFGLTLSESDRELLDRLSAQQGVSRTTIISRALHLLQSVQERRT